MRKNLFEKLLSVPEYREYYEGFYKILSDCLSDYVPIAFSRSDIDSLASYLAHELTADWYFFSDFDDDLSDSGDKFSDFDGDFYD